jgi:APA family basic amino acid/polyamine antiporter
MATTTSLPQRISLVQAAAIVVSNTLGTGIFATPGIVARIVNSEAALMLLWAVGGVLALCGAVSYGALASRYPRAGGEYVYLREALGPFAGFLSGWTSFIAGFSGAIAAGAMAVAAYALPNTTAIKAKIVACAVILSLALLHSLRVRTGLRTQVIIACANMVLLCVLIAGGLSTAAHEEAARQQGGARISAFLLALVPVMFTYSGWNAAAYVAEEVNRPEKNVARALLLGASIVTALYLATNAALIHAVGMDGLRGRIDVAGQLGSAAFGASGAAAVRVGTSGIILASLSAMTIAGPRVYFSMARDGCFPAAIAKVSGASPVPRFAIIAQSIWSCILVLTGTFEQILIYTGFAVVLFSTLAVMTVLLPGKRAYKVSTIMCALLFTVAGLMMLGSSIWRAPRPSLLGAALILAGTIVYWMTHRKAARTDSVTMT